MSANSSGDNGSRSFSISDAIFKRRGVHSFGSFTEALEQMVFPGFSCEDGIVLPALVVKLLLRNVLRPVVVAIGHLQYPGVRGHLDAHASFAKRVGVQAHAVELGNLAPVLIRYARHLVEYCQNQFPVQTCYLISGEPGGSRTRKSHGFRVRGIRQFYYRFT